MCEWPLRLWRHWSHSLDGPIHRRSADAEEFGQLGLGVGAEIVQLKQVLGLVRLQLRLLASQPSFRLGDLHALPGAHPDQVGIKLGDHCKRGPWFPGVERLRCHTDVVTVPPSDVAAVVFLTHELTELRRRSFDDVDLRAGDEMHPLPPMLLEELARRYLGERAPHNRPDLLRRTVVAKQM